MDSQTTNIINHLSQCVSKLSKKFKQNNKLLNNLYQISSDDIQQFIQGNNYSITLHPLSFNSSFDNDGNPNCPNNIHQANIFFNPSPNSLNPSNRSLNRNFTTSISINDIDYQNTIRITHDQNIHIHLQGGGGGGSSAVSSGDSVLKTRLNNSIAPISDAARFQNYFYLDATVGNPTVVLNLPIFDNKNHNLTDFIRYILNNSYRGYIEIKTATQSRTSNFSPKYFGLIIDNLTNITLPFAIPSLKDFTITSNNPSNHRFHNMTSSTEFTHGEVFEVNLFTILDNVYHGGGGGGAGFILDKKMPVFTGDVLAIYIGKGGKGASGDTLLDPSATPAELGENTYLYRFNPSGRLCDVLSVQGGSPAARSTGGDGSSGGGGGGYVASTNTESIHGGPGGDGSDHQEDGTAGVGGSGLSGGSGGHGGGNLLGNAAGIGGKALFPATGVHGGGGGGGGGHNGGAGGNFGVLLNGNGDIVGNFAESGQNAQPLTGCGGGGGGCNVDGTNIQSGGDGGSGIVNITLDFAF